MGLSYETTAAFFFCLSVTAEDHENRLRRCHSSRMLKYSFFVAPLLKILPDFRGTLAICHHVNCFHCHDVFTESVSCKTFFQFAHKSSLTAFIRRNHLRFTRGCRTNAGKPSRLFFHIRLDHFCFFPLSRNNLQPSIALRNSHLHRRHSIMGPKASKPVY